MIAELVLGDDLGSVETDECGAAGFVASVRAIDRPVAHVAPCDGHLATRVAISGGATPPESVAPVPCGESAPSSDRPPQAIADEMATMGPMQTSLNQKEALELLMLQCTPNRTACSCIQAVSEPAGAVARNSAKVGVESFLTAANIGINWDTVTPRESLVTVHKNLRPERSQQSLLAQSPSSRQFVPQRSLEAISPHRRFVPFCR